jgi:enoyl-CoA hydratase
MTTFGSALCVAKARYFVVGAVPNDHLCYSLSTPISCAKALIPPACHHIPSAGADLKAVSGGGPVFTEKGGFAGLAKRLRTKPLIAAVHGAALAGGCEIVLSCDLCVATSNARFGIPEVKRSLIAAAGGLYRLPRKLPVSIAMECALTGNPITAQRAYDVGMVNRLVGESDDNAGAALAAAMELADECTQNAPMAVRMSRDVVAAASGMDDDALLELTNGGSSPSCCPLPSPLSTSDGRFCFSLFFLAKFKNVVATEDFLEGPKAFIEKRPPVWTGKPRAPAAKL